MNKYLLREIHKDIDRQSYSIFNIAVRFTDSHRLLTLNQATGLLNVVNSEKSINTVLVYFILHQASKTTTHDSSFWVDLKRELDGLKSQSEEIQQRVVTTQQQPEFALEGKKAQKELRDEIHLLLAREYVQHLVAHTIYKHTQTGGY